MQRLKHSAKHAAIDAALEITPKKDEVAKAEETKPERVEPDLTKDIPDDPTALAEAYHDEHLTWNSPENPASVMQMYLAGSVDRDSFIGNGDKNVIGQQLAKTYFAKKGQGEPMDLLAMKVSEDLGREVSEQDLVDFMLGNPSGLPRTSPRMREMQDRYKALTGKKLDKATGARLLKEKGKAAVSDPTVKDYIDGHTDQEGNVNWQSIKDEAHALPFLGYTDEQAANILAEADRNLGTADARGGEVLAEVPKDEGDAGRSSKREAEKVAKEQPRQETPAQIKSATGNNGNFDSANPNIQEQRGEAPQVPLTGVTHIDSVTKALSNLVPNLKVEVRNDSKTYKADVNGRGDVNSSAFYDEDAETIYINLPRAKDNTLFHEAAHPVLRAVIANNPDVLEDLYNQLKDHPDFQKYKEFGDLYPDKSAAEQKEESLVEHMGDAVVQYLKDLESGKARTSALPKSLYQRLKQWIKDMLAKLGFGPKDIKLDPTNLRKFVEDFAKAMTEGIKVRGEKVKQGERTSLQHDADRLVDGWYSRLDDAVANKGNTQSGADWSKWMEARAKDGSLSAEEVKWTGLGDWLAGKGKEKVTPKEVREFLKDNRVKVEVMELGAESEPGEPYDPESTRFSQYQLPGGTNYREVLVTLPVKSTPDQTKTPGQLAKELYDKDSIYDLTPEQQAEVMRRNQPTKEQENKFRSSHFDEPNILVHLRVNDRTDADGKKVLFVEEMQSDWGQKGKKVGFSGNELVPDAVSAVEIDNGIKAPLPFYRVSLSNGKDTYVYADSESEAKVEAIKQWVQNSKSTATGLPPAAPFVTSTGAWVELGLKQAIRMAVDGGYDKIAWANGAQQVNHYRGALQKNVDRIEWTKTPEGIQLLGSKNGVKTVDTTESESALSDAIGKSMGDKIINDPGQSGVIDGDDITISDTGMAGFYDKILPNVAKKVSKKLGGDGNVGETKMPNIGDQQSITITPEMRAKVGMGVPLMQLNPEKVAAAMRAEGFDAKAAKDYLEGENITEEDKKAIIDKVDHEHREERRLTKRVMNDPSIDAELKKAVTPEAIYYDRLPHNVSKAQANQLLSVMTDKEAENAILDKGNGMHMATRFIMGIEQLRKYNEAKDYDAASAFYDKFVPMTTEAGQGISALRELGSELGKDGLVEKAKRDVLAGANRELTPEELKEVQRLADRVEKAPEGRPKYDAMEDLLKYQQQLKGMDWWEVPMSIWYANVLSGPTTHLKNFIANSVNASMLFSNAIIQRPTSAVHMAKGIIEGTKRGVLEAGATWNTGYSPIRGKVEIPAVLERVNFKGGGFNPANYLKYVRRAMVAADVFSFEGLKEMRAYQLALSEAAKDKNPDMPSVSKMNRALDRLNKTDKSIAKAKQQAEEEYQVQRKEATNAAERKKAKRDKSRRVFELLENGRDEQLRDDTHSFAARGTYNYKPEGFLGFFAESLNQMGNEMPAFKLVVPFTNIIANITNDAMNYSPLGAIRAGMNRQTFGKFNTEKLSSQERADLYTKAAMGTALMAAAYMLSQPGDDDDKDKKEPVIQITANGTGDYRKNEELRRTGWQPYSVKVGDHWLSYQYTPMLLGLSYIGNLRDYEKYRNGKLSDTKLSRFTVSGTWALRTVLDQTFISGLNGFLSALMDPRNEDKSEDAAKSAAAVLRGFAVPNLYTQSAQEIQEMRQEPMKETSGTSFGQYLKDIPVAKDAYTNKINALGEPVIANRNIFVSQVKDDPIWQVIADKRAFIGVPRRKAVTIHDPHDGMKERMLTDQEYYDFCKDRGAFIKAKIQENLSQMQKATPAEVQKYVTKWKTAASKNAKKLLYQRLLRTKAKE